MLVLFFLFLLILFSCFIVVEYLFQRFVASAEVGALLR